MAGGTKKKKKPTNPARGFATTSVASKPKAESEAPSTTTSGVASPSEKTSVETQVIETASPAVVSTERELHELSPEELEAQLEASELQQFVEKYGAKVKKEVSRQVVRLQTDKRLLRGQSEYLSVRDWLPDELMQQILDLTLADLKNDVNSQKKPASPTGDDLVAKVWQLRQCLLDLAFPLERVNDVVGWVISSPPSQSTVGSLWGLEECLEWLALHCDVGELDDYDFERQRVNMDDGDEPEEAVELETKDWKAAKTMDTSLPETIDGKDSGLNEEKSVEVSDVESDMEPDELLSVYLRTKARLYELNPDVDASTVGKKKSSKQSKAPANRSSGERKLEQKLQKIENDVLFDQREADAHWAAHKISLVRDTAERRRLQLHDNHDPTPARSSVTSTPPSGVSDEAERMGQELLAATNAAEDDDLLSGMFDALPGVSDSAAGGSSGEGAGEGVTIRDFGRLVGMNPKRVLEEACKARDAKCKQAYRMISPTTYASRHSVTIQWTKQQESFEHVFLPSVTVQYRPLKTVITMVQTATPDTAQSEAFVATAALFLIFSGSPKEEKVHLRLSAAFRDLWDEFTRAKAEHAQAEECATVKEVRALVDRHSSTDDEDDDEVVFNVNTRRRLDGTSGSSTPVKSGTRRMQQPEVIEELQQMWARKTSTPAYQRMLVGRKNLPMYHFRNAALDTIQRHQVTILCGETGCGKSTQLPAFILENELANGRPCKIYCTEPRRISAISLAQRVSEEMGENKGDVGTFRSLVGYAIRLESQTTAQTRLVYATVGIVLRMLENSNGLNDITHLILDEVHERSIDTDFLLIVLRSLMLKRPDLKVVLMSATVNAQRFSEYLDGAPIIDVPGRTFPVEAKFLEDAIELTGHTNEDATTAAVDEDNNEEDAQEKGTSDQPLNGYSKKTRNTLATYDEYRIDYSLIVKLIEKIGHHAQYQDYSKAILVFLPGIAEIRQVNDMLCGHPRFAKGWRVFPLHSTFSSEDQQAAFEIPPPGIRKIVLATNIAETGITIPDVTCVIDTGKHKEMRFDERRQMSRLIQSFIARANAKQRRGRAGRVQQGLCFHLFTKYRHDHIMVDAQTPEMLRLSLQDLVMRVKICKLGDIEHALSQALDPPSSRNIRRAIDALVEVGALTSGEDLTPLGNQLAKLPLDAQLGKLILLGGNFGCLDFALTAAATLSSKTPFLNPMHQKKQADTVRLGFKRGDSDLLTAYNAYTTWRKICITPHMSEFSFCNKNFLSSQNLGNIEDLKAQLLSSLIDAGFVHLGPDERTALNRMRHNTRNRNFVMLPPQYTKSDENDVLASSVVAWSFYPKIVKQDGKGWRNISNNQSLGLHPTSVNKTSLNPDIKFLSFYSIMQSSSRFTNAQETSPVAEIPLLMMCGEAVFHMYAGVVVVDGNRLRLKVRDWRTMVVLKVLRAKSKEVMAKLFRNPGRELGDRPRRWLEILEKIFEKQGVKAAATRT